MPFLFSADDRERRTVKTVADRAEEAVEAAEIMFAEEMGATLDLTPAAKMALIVKIAAAIEAAVAEERQSSHGCCSLTSA